MPRRYSREECPSAIRRAANVLDESPSRRDYADLEFGPAPSTLVSRSGSWNEAKRAAGLDPVRGGRKPKPVRTEFFACIDSTVAAYWLGFLFGDGHMMVRNRETGKRAVRLYLAEKDEDHLVRYKRAIRSRSAIVVDGDMRCLTVGDQTFAEHLFDHGLTNTKSTDGTLPELDSWSLRRGFIRGLADADGYYGEYKWTITDATDRRLRKLHEWVPVETDVVHESYDGRNWAYLRVLGRERLRPLYAWLFPKGMETEPSLPRKRDTAVRVLSDAYRDLTP